ncbi:hypothetical protein Tco_0222017 [Tanacetum coccineum]
MENPYMKHGLVSKTYYKKSLIMALTFGSKSKFFMTTSIPSQDEALTNRPVSVKAIALPQDVPSTSDRCLIELENQVQHLMEAHLALTQPTQVNKITTSCEICSGPHDTQHCMEDPEQAFFEYASSRIDEVGGKWYTFKPEQNNLGDIYNPSWRSYPNLSDSYDEKANENEEEEKNSPENIHVNPSIPPDLSVAFITEKVLKFNSFFKSLGLVPQSSHTEVVCTKGDDGEVMFIEIIRKNDDSREDGPEEEGNITTEGVGVEHFDMFPTRNELAYHKYLVYGLIPLIFLRNPIITEGCPSNLKIPCNIGHVHVEKAYIDPNSPLNIMTRMMYN